jgi:hypothetical protein
MSSGLRVVGVISVDFAPPNRLLSALHSPFLQAPLRLGLGALYPSLLCQVLHYLTIMQCKPFSVIAIPIHRGLEEDFRNCTLGDGYN